MNRKAIAAILVAAMLSAGVWAFLRWRESEAAGRIPSPGNKRHDDSGEEEPTPCHEQRRNGFNRKEDREIGGTPD